MPKDVVPLAGTWVEIMCSECSPRIGDVVPLAGTWVEIPRGGVCDRERPVVPLAGTWVEMTMMGTSSCWMMCRSPRGDMG